MTAACYGFTKVSSFDFKMLNKKRRLLFPADCASSLKTEKTMATEVKLQPVRSAPPLQVGSRF